MYTYCLIDFDSSVYVQHERCMTRDELRALLLEHLAPLATAQQALLAEGLERFGGGSRFAYVEDGQVLRYDTTVMIGVDPIAFEEWYERLHEATAFVIRDLAAAAGFTVLEPTASVSCAPYGSPWEMIETLERGR